MMSTELKTAKDSVEKILSDWTITDDLEAISKVSHFNITEQQMNQVISLGLVVSKIYRSQDTLVISFSPMRRFD